MGGGPESHKVEVVRLARRAIAERDSWTQVCKVDTKEKKKNSSPWKRNRFFFVMFQMKKKNKETRPGCKQTISRQWHMGVMDPSQCEAWDGEAEVDDAVCTCCVNWHDATMLGCLVWQSHLPKTAVHRWLCGTWQCRLPPQPLSLYRSPPPYKR